MTYKLSLFLAISLSFVVMSGHAGERITYNQPTALTGTLKSSQGETPDGEAVDFPSLLLDTTITVDAIPNDDLNGETEKGVVLIQLALDDGAIMKQFSILKGKRASVVCSLFHSFTGYHYTDVLCEASSIRAL